MVGPVEARFPVAGVIAPRELARRFAVAATTVRRRLHAEGRCLYAHPEDRRLRLVADEDARLVFRLTPAPRRTRDDGVSEAENRSTAAPRTRA